MHGPAERAPLKQRDSGPNVVVEHDAGVAADLRSAGGMVDQVILGGRDHDVVASGHVVLGDAAGGARPWIGVDRVPVAVPGTVIAMCQLVGELVGFVDGGRGGCFCHQVLRSNAGILERSPVTSADAPGPGPADSNRTTT